MKQLGVEHITAYSPEARGRSERIFGTIQDRLVNELKLVGIATMEAANRYLYNVYLPRHNLRFTVKPDSERSGYVPVAGFDIANILCIQEDRVVAPDNTVRYRGRKLQIPPTPCRHITSKRKCRGTITPTIPSPSFSDQGKSAL